MRFSHIDEKLTKANRFSSKIVPLYHQKVKYDKIAKITKKIQESLSFGFCFIKDKETFLTQVKKLKQKLPAAKTRLKFLLISSY